MKKIIIPIEFLSIIIEVHIVKYGQISAERNKLLKKYPKLPKFSDDSSTAGLHTSYYEYYWNTWIFLEKGCPISIANHEIQHAVDYISSYFNIKDTEFRAYLFEYITRKIIGDKSI